MKVSTYALVAAFGLTAAGTADAQIIVDGVIDANYGAPLSVQTVQTGFGNNLDPTGLGGGSELNAGYATIDNGKLYIGLAGNLEANFNKLFVFIDSVPGGQNTIDAANNPTLDPFNGGGYGNSIQAYDGFTFDAGFEADYAIKLNSGNFGGARTDLGFGIIGGGANDFDEYGAVFYDPVTFATSNFGSAVVNPTTANPLDFQNVINLGTEIELGWDNSNVAGVFDGTQPADQALAEAVTTGIEFGLDLADLGNPTGDIKISVMVNNGTSDFLSNQFLGGLIPQDDDEDPLTPSVQGNLGQDGLGGFLGRPEDEDPANLDLGGLGLIDLNDFEGDQFFTLSQGGGTITGDYNGDGFVSQPDLDLVLLNWGDASLPAGFDEDALDGGGPFDNLISQNELDGVLLNWGDGTPPAPVSAIPEPTSAALLGLGGLALAIRRRRA